VRIESVRFDASGNATIVVTGGVSFFIPCARVFELPLPETLEADKGDLSPENLAYAKTFLNALAIGDFEFGNEDEFFLALAAIDEEERARHKAIQLCARAEQSSSGLAAKLAAKGFSRKAAASAIESLKNEKIVDDARYARIWARGRAARRAAGPACLAAELRSRGQGEDAVRGALAEIDFDGVLARAAAKELARLDRSSLARFKAKPDLSREKHRDERFWDELYHVLKRQGFDGEKIREEISQLRGKAF